MKKAGVIIDPLKFSEELTDRTAELRQAPPEDLKVSTVAGGTVSGFKTFSRVESGNNGKSNTDKGVDHHKKSKRRFSGRRSRDVKPIAE